MITEIRFQNFRVLQDAKLQLEPLTVIVGPNGSGKSTVFLALRNARTASHHGYDRPHWDCTTGVDGPAKAIVTWKEAGHNPEEVVFDVRSESLGGVQLLPDDPPPPERGAVLNALVSALGSMLVLSPMPERVAAPVKLALDVQIGEDGSGLAGVLDRLQGESPERFAALNHELGQWFPEFDHVLLPVVEDGAKTIELRARDGRHRLPASALSHGTLLGLLFLTLAHLPDPPRILCVEEPDRGIHPRLLRYVREALLRLAYPADYRQDHEPVQVIATTHSPYMLNLFRDDPQQVVIAEKEGMFATFKRLIDHPEINEILEDSLLGDAWYTGVLGGVPALT